MPSWLCKLVHEIGKKEVGYFFSLTFQIILYQINYMQAWKINH